MKTINQVALFYKEGSSDKVYNVQLVEKDSGEYAVNFQYGLRGSTLTTGSKIETDDQSKAKKEYDKLVKSKTAKGYTEETTGAVFSSKEFTAQKSTLLPQLLNAIENPEDYINNPAYVAQEKMDGERRMAEVKESQKSIQGVNRKGLVVQLPEVIEKSLTAPSADMEVDGEQIGDTLYVFDLLALDGEDYRSKKFSSRMEILETLSFGKNVKIVPVAKTTKEKQALFDKVKANKGEGIVFKLASAPYKVGRPNSGGDHLKFKFTKTATFIVSGKTEGKRSVGLMVREGKKNVEVGKVTIPSNHSVPKTGSLVEVEYLYAFKGGSVFQPVYLGERTDLDQEDASINQLVYKTDKEDEVEVDFKKQCPF